MQGQYIAAQFSKVMQLAEGMHGPAAILSAKNIEVRYLRAHSAAHAAISTARVIMFVDESLEALKLLRRGPEAGEVLGKVRGAWLRHRLLQGGT